MQESPFPMTLTPETSNADGTLSPAGFPSSLSPTEGSGLKVKSTLSKDDPSKTGNFPDKTKLDKPPLDKSPLNNPAIMSNFFSGRGPIKPQAIPA